MHLTPGTAICHHLPPSGLSGETARTPPHVRSQIYSLRVVSAFWLTPNKPQRPTMANMWRDRLSPDARVHWAHAPGMPCQHRLGSVFSDSLSRAAPLVNCVVTGARKASYPYAGIAAPAQVCLEHSHGMARQCRMAQLSQTLHRGLHV